MKYFLRPTKDTTIYSDYPTQNTGIDAILNLFKIKSDSIHINSRVLLQFDLTEMSASINQRGIANPKYLLELKTTNLRELAQDFVLYTYPISGSWDMGIGKRQDTPKTTIGASWRYKDYIGGTEWESEGGDYLTSTTVENQGDIYHPAFNLNAFDSSSYYVLLEGAFESSSFAENAFYIPSDNFYPTISSSFYFDTKAIDVVFDVTDIVESWLSKEYPNHGFIVKFGDSEELDNNNYGEVNFFSNETNTIYRPALSINWDDSDFEPDILQVVDDDEIFCTITNLKKMYKVDNQYKFKIKTRPEYLQPSFSTISPYSVTYVLPENSYFSIVDNVTEDVIVPFSPYSKISADSNGSYFNQDFTGWEPERFYRIIIKVENEDGNIQYIDKNFTFNLVE